MVIRSIFFNKFIKVMTVLIVIIFILGMNMKMNFALTYNSSLFPAGYQGGEKEKVVFYSRTLKYEDNYYLEGATLEVTDDTHPQYVTVTFRHYVGHSGDHQHSNYMVVPCAFYIDDKLEAQWFVSGYDNTKNSEYKEGHRFRNTYRCVYTKEGIRVKRGKTIRLSAYDVGESVETVSPLIWSKDYIYEYPLYELDVSLTLNGKGIDKDVGTFDVYIDHQLKADNVSAFHMPLYYNQSYEIKDINAKAGYSFKKFLKGQQKGTISKDVTCVLDFMIDDYVFKVDFDYNKYGETYQNGARVKMFDIYKNGELLMKDTDDFITHQSHYQDVYLIKNIRYKERCGYSGIDSEASQMKYYNGEISLIHDQEKDIVLSINTLYFYESDSYGSIRFIDIDTLYSLRQESLWVKDDMYKKVLNESLNSHTPIYSFSCDEAMMKSLKDINIKPSYETNQKVWGLINENNG